MRTIFFIQVTLQYNIAASGIFTRTVGAKGIDIAMIQELGTPTTVSGE